jgi:hypothetical protein
MKMHRDKCFPVVNNEGCVRSENLWTSVACERFAFSLYKKNAEACSSHEDGWRGRSTSHHIEISHGSELFNSHVRGHASCPIRKADVTDGKMRGRMWTLSTSQRKAIEKSCQLRRSQDTIYIRVAGMIWLDGRGPLCYIAWNKKLNNNLLLNIFIL